MIEIPNQELISLVGRGVPIERLEARMRPMGDLDRWWKEEGYAEKEVARHDGWENFSGVGFLGANESLLEVIVADYKVVESSGTTHRDIGIALANLVKGKIEPQHGYTFLNWEEYSQFVDALWIGNDGKHDLHKNERWSLDRGGEQGCPWYCLSEGDIIPHPTKPIQSRKRKMNSPFYPYGYIHADPIGNNKGDHNLYIGSMGLIVKSDLFQDGSVRKLMGYIKNKNVEDTSIAPAAIEAVKKYLSQEGTIHVRVTGLLPHLIGEHYFFEGRDISHRADPFFLINALGLYQKSPAATPAGK